MDIGAPEPTVKRQGSQLLVSYFARDDAVAVLRFDDVRTYSFGPPNDEGLADHPLYALGLKPYAFFKVSSLGSRQQRTPAASFERYWIATFHDDTLEVHAQSAVVLTRDAQQQSPDEALAAFLLAEP